MIGIALLLLCSGTVHAAALTQSDLCGQWIQAAVASNGKTCVPTQQCGCSASCPRLTQNMIFDTSSSKYSLSSISYGSSSCNSNQQYNVTYGGTYSLGGETVTNWTGVDYTPNWWEITPFTGGNYPLNASDVNNCTDLISYLNSNCPCNGTWATGVTRNITLSQCPNNTCTDTMIFDSRKQYGNIQRQENTTAGTVFLLITFTDPDQTTGHNITNVNFYQKPGCGLSCKSCTITPTGPTACTACCASHSQPQLDGSCTCASGYMNKSTNPFVLQCNHAAQIYPISSLVYIMLALVGFKYGA